MLGYRLQSFRMQGVTKMNTRVSEYVANLENNGQVVRLTETVQVTIGETVQVSLHPSGRKYDGDAIVVAAFLGGIGPNYIPMVSVISVNDETCRIVAMTL